jgi:hypothetical protein
VPQRWLAGQRLLRFGGCTFRRAGDPAADDENAELIVIDP